MKSRLTYLSILLLVGFILPASADNLDRWQPIQGTNMLYDTLSTDKLCGVSSMPFSPGGLCSIWVKQKGSTKKYTFNCISRQSVGYWVSKGIEPGSSLEPIYFQTCGRSSTSNN